MAGMFSQLKEVENSTQNSPTSPVSTSKNSLPAAPLAETASPTPPLTRSSKKRRPVSRSNEQANEPTFVRTKERLPKRAKIRHTFDIFADQLMSLREISLEQEKLFGERVLLGDLAQQALDMFITKERNG